MSKIRKVLEQINSCGCTESSKINYSKIIAILKKDFNLNSSRTKDGDISLDREISEDEQVEILQSIEDYTTNAYFSENNLISVE